MAKSNLRALLMTLQSRTGTGQVRVAPRMKRNQAALELIDQSGSITQVRLSAEELRLLAANLLKVVALLNAANHSEEITQP